MNEFQGKPKILTVDDKPENLYALAKILQKLDVEIHKANSGNEALSLTLKNEYYLAIVDIQMPEMDGYELVELLRGNPATATLPVIFISAIYSDDYHHRKGYDAGAVDFLSKPFVPEILLSKVKVFLDLYQKRTLLEELVRQNEALYKQEEARARELAELNASKDKFFSIVSHDLRTPFNSLIGNSQLLLMELENTEDTGKIELADTILHSAKNAHRLLENLLTWSMLQNGMLVSKPETLEMEQVIEAVLELLSTEAQPKNIQLASKLATKTNVFADLQMVNTILRNLISNAIKFTPEGGCITISTKLQLNYDATDATFVEVSVKDTGVGIESANIAKLFTIEAQHSTEGTKGEAGAGLGLILCKEMVEANNGRISVTSQLEKGTTITFTLPVATTPEPMPSE